MGTSSTKEDFPPHRECLPKVGYPKIHCAYQLQIKCTLPEIWHNTQERIYNLIFCIQMVESKRHNTHSFCKDGNDQVHMQSTSSCAMSRSFPNGKRNGIFPWVFGICTRGYPHCTVNRGLTMQNLKMMFPLTITISK